VSAVAASPANPPPAGGKRGGGGRFEWTVAWVLAALVLRRMSRGSVNWRTHSVGLRH
jgi:hypothetical protein